MSIPPSIRGHFNNNKRHSKTLKTRDLAEANRRKWKWIAHFKELNNRVRASRQDAPMVEALQRRRELELYSDHREIGLELAVERAEEIEATHGLETAQEFYSVVAGKRTPIGEKIDLWLNESDDLRPKTRDEYRKSVNDLRTWAGGEAFVETVSRREAGRYVSEDLRSKGLARATIRRHISALSSFWRWLMQKGFAEVNPWTGQAPPRRRDNGRGQQKTRRACTDDELATLLLRATHPLLSDAIKITALSGLRLEEIGSLKVEDVADGFFHIRRGKTRNALRRVPIHPDVTAIVARRTRGKDGEALIFHELGKPNKNGQLTSKLSKRFTRFRRDVGIDDRQDGQRQSAVTFHSLRHWFATAAERAGQRPEVLEPIMGHARTGMTFGLYAEGPSDGQLRACVEAVRLPIKEAAAQDA